MNTTELKNYVALAVIRVRSAKRIQSGSAKQSHLRSAKRIHLSGLETGKKRGPDRPSGSTRDRALEPVMDGRRGARKVWA